MKEWEKRFVVRVYGDDDILKEEFVFLTKAQQLEKYYNLIQRHKRDRVEKDTNWYYIQ